MDDTGLIFQHIDDDGDQIRVEEVGMIPHSDSLYLKNTKRTGETNVVCLKRAYVRRLHSVLGAWLSRDGVTAESVAEPTLHVDESTTADDVRRIARDEFLKVLSEGRISARMRGIAREIFREELAKEAEGQEHVMRQYAREELREMFRSYGNEDA